MRTLLQTYVSLSIYFYLKSALAIACETRNAMEPRHGLRCLTTASASTWQAAHPQCVWRCLQMKTCHYINYDSDTRQCELGMGQCESLQTAAGFMVNVFGPPRHDCLYWGSNQISGWVPVQERNGKIYLAPIVSADVVLVGKLNTQKGDFWGKNGGVKVGPINVNDKYIEILSKDPVCPLPWMPYTAGEPLPFGAVTGGRLRDGSATYVAKVTHNGDVNFGYYDPTISLTYYQWYGVHTATSMELLVLL